jgi:hypothetical protein
VNGSHLMQCRTGKHMLSSSGSIYVQAAGMSRIGNQASQAFFNSSIDEMLLSSIRHEAIDCHAMPKSQSGKVKS